MNLGKQVRLQRIFNRETGRAIIVPMDHGVSVGPIEGIENIHKTVSDMADGGADAVLMHKGLCRCCFRASGEGKDVGLIIHLSASTSLSSYSNKKRLVCTVEEAIRRGADGVSVHVNLGDDNESDMLADLGEVARVAEEWSMPLLAMLYARGPRITNEFDPAVVAHCARVGVELGADIVKVPYTGDIDSFAEVIAGCCVPVVIAGGPRTETTREFLEMVDNSLKAGGSGLSVGRNVFQHPKRVQLVRALRGLVHQGLSLLLIAAASLLLQLRDQGRQLRQILAVRLLPRLLGIAGAIPAGQSRRLPHGILHGRLPLPLIEPCIALIVGVLLRVVGIGLAGADLVVQRRQLLLEPGLILPRLLPLQALPQSTGRRHLIGWGISLLQLPHPAHSLIRHAGEHLTAGAGA